MSSNANKELQIEIALQKIDEKWQVRAHACCVAMCMLCCVAIGARVLCPHPLSVRCSSISIVMCRWRRLGGGSSIAAVRVIHGAGALPIGRRAPVGSSAKESESLGEPRVGRSTF